MTTEERIKETIKLDILEYYRSGKPLSDRDIKWCPYIQEQIIKIRKQIENEEEIRHERVLKRIHTDKKEKLPYKEWREKADKLYSKEENDDCQWIVTSIAKGLDHRRTEICESRKDANKYIESLIKIKYYDHFIRGYDFMYDPDTIKEEK